MSSPLSLAPGFSPVIAGKNEENRFNGFPPAGKPLKRLTSRRRQCARLKPGVNKRKHHVTYC